ncbi:hypothetical protein BKA70DRAFT_677463 [Coprinopsis sp. MPI-PUGE-AT-0042]|nr:hypothetical protein BKA70DRAFT_677463 [Coprinopsis sp. MPI-PUGE-AT-0042]
MSLRLVLTDRSRPWDTVYRTEDGEPLYRAERIDYSSMKCTSTVAIYKIHAGGDEKVDFSQIFGLKHTDLATLRLRYVHSDELTINGVEMKAKDLFTKPMGLRWYGRDRVWKGPDGQEYRWEMGLSKPELFRNVNDKKDATVAKFHREHSGRMGIHDQSQASLEIMGEVSEELLDMIVITFVYMETTRAQRELATAQAGAANAGSSTIAAVAAT